ncbi:MAG: hypothetical protein SOY04_00135 [Clostridium celatum]|nr:hypothetical protein [Clostridium celatum]
MWLLVSILGLIISVLYIKIKINESLIFNLQSVVRYNNERLKALEVLIDDKN